MCMYKVFFLSIALVYDASMQIVSYCLEASLKVNDNNNNNMHHSHAADVFPLCCVLKHNKFRARTEEKNVCAVYKTTPLC